MKRYQGNTATIATLAFLITLGGSAPGAFAGVGGCTVCSGCPGNLTACFPGGTPVSACLDLGCLAQDTSDACGVGVGDACPTSEAGQCDDGINNDAWVNNLTDCDDPACATDPVCLVGVVVTVPFDLNLGDEYRLLFVTSSVTDATSADIGVYNAVVAADAAAVPELDALGTTFTAVASTPTVDAFNNTMTDPSPVGDTGVPIYLLNGFRFADDYDSLWTSDGPLVGGVPIPDGTLPFIPTSSGNSPPNSVWTGSSQLGAAGGLGPLGDPDDIAGFGTPHGGSNFFPSFRWVLFNGSAVTAEFPLYGMSEVLTVCIHNTTQGTFPATIQGALDVAMSGDVIELGACTFFEDNIVFPTGVDVTLRGAGRDQTFIDGISGSDVFGVFEIIGSGQTTATVIEDLTIQNDTRGNTPGSSGIGGAIAVMGAGLTIRRVDFIGNISTAGASALNLRGGSTAVVSECRFFDNGTGSTVLVAGDGQAIFVGCLIEQGPALFAVSLIDNGNVTCTNCTVIGRIRARHTAFGQFNNCAITGETVTEDSGAFAFSRSLFSGATGDNIDGLPTFVDAPGGDYRLAPGSLGIDAADHDAYVAAGGGATDLNGDPRLHGCALDMGSYENQNAGFVPVLNVTQGTDHPTIQGSLDAAASGDVIELGACTFFEDNLTIPNGVQLTLQGAGMDQTFIDGGSDDALRVFLLSNSGQTSDTVIADLTISTSGGGSAVRLDNTSPIFRRVRFFRCTNSALDDRGGATYDRCVFTECGGFQTFFKGGASTSVLRQCLFADNETSLEAIVNAGSATLVNCTLDAGSALRVRPGAQADVFNTASTGTFNLFIGGVLNSTRSVYPGATGDNIDGGPTFFDAPGGDYRLAPGSLGIDAADHDAYVAAGGGATDLSGDPRTHDDTGTPDTGSGVLLTYLDMGAFEFQGTTVPGDCNGDGVADLFDHKDFIDCLLGPGGGLGVDCDCFDQDHDGDVDMEDFAAFQLNFAGS